MFCHCNASFPTISDCGLRINNCSSESKRKVLHHESFSIHRQTDCRLLYHTDQSNAISNVSKCVRHQRLVTLGIQNFPSVKMCICVFSTPGICFVNVLALMTAPQSFAFAYPFIISILYQNRECEPIPHSRPVIQVFDYLSVPIRNSVIPFSQSPSYISISPASEAAASLGLMGRRAAAGILNLCAVSSI